VAKLIWIQTSFDKLTREKSTYDMLFKEYLCEEGGYQEFKDAVSGALKSHKCERVEYWKYLDLVTKLGDYFQAQKEEMETSLDEVLNGLDTPTGAQPLTEPKQEETEMTQVNIIKIESKVVINDTDISDYSDVTLFQYISNAEAEIKELEAIQNKPNSLELIITEHKQGIKDLVSYMDNRYK